MNTIRNYSGEEVGTQVHKFEAAGLGKAPFRFVRFEVKLHQACQGAPITAGTSCDYCGTAIANVFWIRDANGKEFKVGSDCVGRTGDAGLLRVINAKVAEHKRNMSHKRDDAKISAGKDALPTVAKILAASPHSIAYMADKGLTLLDEVQWLFAHAGRSGQVRAAKIVLARV